jgi:hypothetical protein
MTTFDELHGEVMLLNQRIKRAPMRDSVTPAEIRAWESEALALIDGFSGAWSTYPMHVEGGIRDCTTAETAFLRKHYRTMTQLYAADALQMPGDQAMTRDEFATRLRSLKESFTWLNENVPPSFQMHLGSYASNLAYVDRELSAFGSAGQVKQGGCYIATAVYGSYDAPEVVALRRFRDESLQTSTAGRAFIRAYYSLSPALAHCVAIENRLNSLARLVLDALVARLDDPARRK